MSTTIFFSPYCYLSLFLVARIVEHVHIVGTIQDHQPPTGPLILQPLMDKLKDVRVGLISARDIDYVCDPFEVFFDARPSTCMDPEYPKPSIFLFEAISHPVRMFDG